MFVNQHYNFDMEPTFDAVTQLYNLLEARRELQFERSRLVAHKIENFLLQGKEPSWIWSHCLEEIESEDLSILFSKLLSLVDIDTKSPRKEIRALHRVAESADYRHLHMLIENNADIDAPDRDGWTPLASYLTTTPCRDDCGKLLLSHGAKLPPMELLSLIPVRYVNVCLREIVTHRNATVVALTLLRVVPDRAESCIMDFLFPTHEELTNNLGIIEEALSF